MSKFNKPVRIKYEYTVKKDERVEYAHGVWGGINPHGEIEMNFYTESDKVPEYSERVVTPDGSVGHELIPEEEGQKIITRDIHSRITMNYHTARAVYEWLDEKLATIESEWEAAGDAAAAFFPEGGGGGLEQ